MKRAKLVVVHILSRQHEISCDRVYCGFLAMQHAARCKPGSNIHDIMARNFAASEKRGDALLYIFGADAAPHINNDSHQDVGDMQ